VEKWSYFTSIFEPLIELILLFFTDFSPNSPWFSIIHCQKHPWSILCVFSVKQGKNIHPRTKTDPKLFAGHIPFHVQQLSGTLINYLTDLLYELASGVNMKVVDLFVIFPTHICTPESDACSSSYDPNTRERKKPNKPISLDELYHGPTKIQGRNYQKSIMVGRRPVLSNECRKEGFRRTTSCVVQRNQSRKPNMRIKQDFVGRAPLWSNELKIWNKNKTNLCRIYLCTDLL